MALNAKQRIFVSEYLKDKNATRAAKAAGYSAKSAKTCGPRMLENADVARAINAGLVRVEARAELKAADVLAEIRKLAFVDMTRAYSEDGSLLPLHEMPEDVRAALTMVETRELFAGRGLLREKVGEAKTIKLTDKVRSLELLAKHFKLLTEVHQHQGADGGPVVILNMPANGSEVTPAEPAKTKSEDDGAGGS